MRSSRDDFISGLVQNRPWAIKIPAILENNVKWHSWLYTRYRVFKKNLCFVLEGHVGLRVRWS